MQILSLNHMGDTLKTTIQIKQDLYTNSYKLTINWETIQVLENVFYTKVSRIRRLTFILFTHLAFIFRIFLFLELLMGFHPFSK